MCFSRDSASTSDTSFPAFREGLRFIAPCHFRSASFSQTLTGDLQPPNSKFAAHGPQHWCEKQLGAFRNNVKGQPAKAFRWDTAVKSLHAKSVPLSSSRPFLHLTMSFKHRHKASDVGESLQYALRDSAPDMQRQESASLLTPSSQSSATTVLRKMPGTNSDDKGSRGYAPIKAWLDSL